MQINDFYQIKVINMANLHIFATAPYLVPLQKKIMKGIY